MIAVLCAVLAFGLALFMYRLRSLAYQGQPYAPLMRIHLLVFGLTAITGFTLALLVLLPELATLSQMLFYATYYAGWPLLVMTWAVQAVRPQGFELGNWGRIFIGWMALFELVRRLGRLDLYWEVLTLVLGAVLLASLGAFYRKGLNNPLMLLLPFMLVALYQQPEPHMQAIIAPLLCFYLGFKLLLPFSQRPALGTPV